MKRVEAILQVHRVSRVVHALHELPHFPGFTVLPAKGQGRGRGMQGHYAGTDEDLVYHERQMLIVICDDDEAEAIAKTIAWSAHTGNRHDGIVMISDVSGFLRVAETHPEDAQS